MTGCCGHTGELSDGFVIVDEQDSQVHEGLNSFEVTAAVGLSLAALPTLPPPSLSPSKPRSETPARASRAALVLSRHIAHTPWPAAVPSRVLIHGRQHTVALAG
jgi:hypothetical protein